MPYFRFLLFLEIIASNCSKRSVWYILFILCSGGIELLFGTWIKGRGSEGMLRLENMKFLKARNAVFLHSGGLLPLYYRFCHSKKTAEEEFV